MEQTRVFLVMTGFTQKLINVLDVMDGFQYFVY